MMCTHSIAPAWPPHIHPIQVSFSSSISTTSTSSGTATVISVSGQADLDVIFEAVSNGEDLAKLVGDMLKAEDVSSALLRTLHAMASHVF